MLQKKGEGGRNVSSRKVYLFIMKTCRVRTLELIYIKGAETNNIADIGKLEGDVLNYAHS